MVSLLEDARRDLPPNLVETMLGRYFDQQKHINRSQFMAEYHVLGVQRHCKVAGIFVRLHKRDGKAHYLKHIPRVLRLLEQGLRQEPLHALKVWFDRYLPLQGIDFSRFH